MKIIASMAAAVMVSGAAVQEPAAICPAPEIPAIERPVKPTRPPVPSCVNEARGTHTCRNAVLTAYQASVERYGQAFDAYVAEVNGYIIKLDAYVRQAADYAECERRIVAPQSIITG